MDTRYSVARSWDELKELVESGACPDILFAGEGVNTSTIVVPVSSSVSIEGVNAHITRPGSPRREFDVCVGARLRLSGDWRVDAAEGSLNAASFVEVEVGAELVLAAQLKACPGEEATGAASFLRCSGRLVMEPGSSVSGWSVRRPGSSARSGAALRVEGPRAEFVMNGGEIFGNANLGMGETPGAAVQLWDGARFLMNGGKIFDNHQDGLAAVNGGGVYVNGSTFVMNGGEISGNQAHCGGGVYVTGAAPEPRRRGRGRRAPREAAPAVTVNGGMISKNRAQYIGGGIYADGGLVLNGAEVSENAALYGGGVFNGGPFTMCGGDISKNHAMSTQRAGGGIFNGRQGSLDVKGGSILGNRCDGIGGGIYNKGVARLSGATVADNTAQLGGGLCNDQGDVDMSGGQVERNSAVRGGGIWNGGAATISGGTVAHNRALSEADDLCNKDSCLLVLASGEELAWYADAEGRRFEKGGEAQELVFNRPALRDVSLHAEPLVA